MFYTDAFCHYSGSILDEREDNLILNVGQSNYISLMSIVRIISKIIFNDSMYHIASVPEGVRKDYKGIKVPCNETLLISNKKLVNRYHIEFVDTEDWMKEICCDILKNRKINITEEEKIVAGEYMRYSSMLNTQYRNRYNVEKDDEKKKGTIVSFYEKNK